MLALKPNCECCNKDLPPDTSEALICSFECTFCHTCAQRILKMVCPNCSGNLVARPIRPREALKNNPASTQRVFNPDGCATDKPPRS